MRTKVSEFVLAAIALACTGIIAVWQGTVEVGVGVIIVAALIVLWGALRRERPSRPSRIAQAIRHLLRPRESHQILALYNAYLLPAGSGIHGLLDQIRWAAFAHTEPAVRALATTIQDRADSEERARARLNNALEGVERVGRQDLQERVGEYYRAYQGARPWVQEGATLSGVRPPQLQSWLALDRQFLEELRRLSGPSEFDRLRAHILAVGWGEEVTASLAPYGGACRYCDWGGPPLSC